MTVDPTLPALPQTSHGGIRSWLRFLVLFLRLTLPYWKSEARWAGGVLTALLVALTAAQVVIAIAFNLWYEKLFSALEQRALAQFLLLIAVLGLIIAGSAGITATHLWVKRRIQVSWRDWLSHRIVNEWMTSGRHYQVAQIPGDHDNPDGRIAEDARITTEYAVDLAHSLFYCLLLLVSFTQILWTLSGPPLVRLGDVDLYLPGHMVWIALVYSAIGSTVALILGWPLVRAANARQTAEANFRFGLVRARENSLAIALLSGETDERRNLYDLFRGAVAAWNRQTAALMRIFLFSSSWSVLSQVFPILVSAPRYIVGAITLGVLMQTAQAFQQMVSALSWPIDNLSKSAEWRASVERVLGLHDAIESLTRQAGSAGHPMIAREPLGRPALAFQDCAIDEPDGREAVARFRIEIAAGERVLVSGDPGSTEKLFKAVAGLWPWGSGRIGLPSDGPIFFMPHRPYVPLGTLRDTVCYPTDPRACGDDAIRRALRRVGLDELAERLDDRERWDDTLPAAELQRLAFARLLIHTPRWIFLQDATDSLSPENEVVMMELLHDAFPEAAVITIGQPSIFGGLYKRQIVIERSNQHARLREIASGPATARVSP
ncbi:MAG: ABC transporter ATP-binding protein/permease [Alphaproteobacteria bacterium]|nr:ABC transporter ATP-binding protein/permease [Alphaproteobacteria bacterium]